MLLKFERSRYMYVHIVLRSSKLSYSPITFIFALHFPSPAFVSIFEICNAQISHSTSQRSTNIRLVLVNQIHISSITVTSVRCGILIERCKRTIYFGYLVDFVIMLTIIRACNLRANQLKVVDRIL